MTDFSPPRRLVAEDNIEGFDCGLPIVNNWLQRHLRTAQQQGTAVAYATFSNGIMVGFYTLSAFSVEHDESPGWIRRNSPDPVPVILLGMLGVDLRFQTMHVGSQLLRDAVIRAMNAADIIGARALVVDPATEHAAGFYERYGFRHIPGSSRMFTPLNLVRNRRK